MFAYVSERKNVLVQMADKKNVQRSLVSFIGTLLCIRMYVQFLFLIPMNILVSA